MIKLTIISIIGQLNGILVLKKRYDRALKTVPTAS